LTAPIINDQFTLERVYPHPVAKVFRALQDPNKKRRWFAGANGLVVDDFTMDFRPGGFERYRFHFGDGPPMTNDHVYLDIVANERIVFAYHMTMDGAPLSSSLASMELEAEDGGTRLRYTEHTMYLDGNDGSAGRREGCEQFLVRLARELEVHP
jgi:uncharacterized protein YndB with AHSA1/START domain